MTRPEHAPDDRDLALDAETECPECDGQGHHDVRQFGRHIEDEYVSYPCHWCDGTGTAPIPTSRIEHIA